MRTTFTIGAAITILILGLTVSGRRNPVAAEDIPSVEQILERYVEAVGGRAALEMLETRVCVGKVITDLSSRKQPIYESHYFKAIAKTPGCCYTEEWTDGGVCSEGYDGTIGWAKDRCGVRTDGRIGTWRLNWLLNPQFALRLEEYYPDLEINGITRMGDIIVYALESPALHRPLFFDTATGLLVGFGYNYQIRDYRDVDGVLYPHQISESRKGGSTTYQFDEVRHNEPVDDSIFAMPE